MKTSNVLVLGRTNKDRSHRPCRFQTSCIACSQHDTCQTEANMRTARQLIFGTK